MSQHEILQKIVLPPSLFRSLFALPIVLSLAFVGCNLKEDMVSTPMNVEQIIRQYRNSPIGKSIRPITKALAAQSVFVGTEGVTPTQDGKIVGKMRLKTGADNQGRMWVYAYTSRAEILKGIS